MISFRKNRRVNGKEIIYFETARCEEVMNMRGFVYCGSDRRNEGFASNVKMTNVSGCLSIMQK